MEESKFKKLSDVPVTSAWALEARDFTPWLANNLDWLGDAVGIELELVMREASLPTEDDRFSADIFAVSKHDDSNVLIENQFGLSDHKHLGQILTYLAGLKAKTIIWVAEQYKDAHLAAIKWLNDHTTEEFAFFAVKVRVVQIGSSPLAPLFDVVERPNNWEKQRHAEARRVKDRQGHVESRKTYWSEFLQQYEEHLVDGKPGGGSTRWRYCCDGQLVVSYFVSVSYSGVYIRGIDRVSNAEVIDLLKPHVGYLSAKFGTAIDANPKYLFHQTIEGDYRTDKDREAIIQWQHEKIRLYESALREISL